MKWLFLAAGVFLFFNGMMSRTYDFPNQVPPAYCWQMDYIKLHSCFSSPAGPQFITWAATLLGAAIIVGCVLYGRRGD